MAIYKTYSYFPRALVEFLEMKQANLMEIEGTSGAYYVFSLSSARGSELRFIAMSYVLRFTDEDYEYLKNFLSEREPDEYKELFLDYMNGYEDNSLEEYWKEHPVVATVSLEELDEAGLYGFLQMQIQPREEEIEFLPVENKLIAWLFSARTEEEFLKRALDLYRRARRVEAGELVIPGRKLKENVKIDKVILFNQE